MPDQRWEFVRDVQAGVPLAEACRRFGISRPTGYKWLARFEADGQPGLVDRSKRPERSPLQTPADIEALVVESRRRFPAWGGRKLRAFLLNQGYEQVPAASTITAILKRNGLLESTPREPAATIRFTADAPNDLWQMDFKGHFGLEDGTRCHAHGILDDHSRFNLALTACPNETTPTVRTILDTTFRTYGRPLAILADNGPPWGSSNPGYRWTPLAVWLADLDIRVIHSRPRHPQTVGKEERFHLTLDTELLNLHPTFANLTVIQHAFDTWRHTYNTVRPHESLANQVPADIYIPSPRPWPNPIPPAVYPDHWDLRVVSKTAQITYHGVTHRIGKPFIGRTIAIDPTTYIAYYRTIPIRHVSHVPERM